MSKGMARLTGLIIAFLIVSLWCVILDRRDMQAAQVVRPRFEQIYNEFIDPPDDGNSPNKTILRNFEVWHDRESGQEFICADPMTSLASAYKVSCWPTGRNWK